MNCHYTLVSTAKAQCGHLVLGGALEGYGYLTTPPKPVFVQLQCLHNFICGVRSICSVALLSMDVKLCLEEKEL